MGSGKYGIFDLPTGNSEEPVIVFAHDLHLIRQNPKNRALSRLIGGDDFKQSLVRLLQILNLDEIVFNQRRAEATIGVHQQRSMLGGPGEPESEVI